VIDFQGGGACWSDETCVGDYRTTVDMADEYDCRAAGDVEEQVRFPNSTSPVGDYTYVYVPYCTRDIHIGNAATTYAS
jgi:hypothetical protein